MEASGRMYAWALLPWPAAGFAVVLPDGTTQNSELDGSDKQLILS